MLSFQEYSTLGRIQGGIDFKVTSFFTFHKRIFLDKSIKCVRMQRFKSQHYYNTTKMIISLFL